MSVGLVFKSKVPLWKRIRAYHMAKNIPLTKTCELCPNKPRFRHHPDYDYPTIIVCTCWACHYWIHRNEKTTEWQNKNWANGHICIT